MLFYLDKKLAYAKVLCYNVEAVGLRRHGMRDTAVTSIYF